MPECRLEVRGVELDADEVVVVVVFWNMVDFCCCRHPHFRQ